MKQEKVKKTNKRKKEGKKGKGKPRKQQILTPNN